MTDTTPSADIAATPAPDPNEQAAAAGVQLDRNPGGRAGATAMGTEFGNPYDPATPPHSVYGDPLREAIELREAEAQAEAERKAKARGTEYRFDGHESPYEWTEVLKTTNGSAKIGETVVLSKDDHAALTSRGFVLTKVEKAAKSDK